MMKKENKIFFFLRLSALPFFVVFAERKIRSNEKSEHCISHAPLYILNFQGFLERRFFDLSDGRVCETPCNVVEIIWTQQSALLFHSAPSKQHFFCFVFLRRRRFLAGAPPSVCVRCNFSLIYAIALHAWVSLSFLPLSSFAKCTRCASVSARLLPLSSTAVFTLQMHECKSCTLKERI